MAKYKYLELRPDQIRLLTLLPSAFNKSETGVELNVVSLSETDTPQYEALSYVWGSLDNSETIFVGKECFTLNVTQNLATALRYLRLSNANRTLWIDAVCINQEDLDERSMQVQKMGSIYKRAKRVVAFLGEKADDSSQALQNIGHIGSQVQVDWLRYTMSPAPGVNSDWADRNAPAQFERRGSEALSKLLSRSWFERVWIRQEIHLASNAIVQCAFATISWAHFRNAIFCFAYKKIVLDLSDAALDDFNQRLDFVYYLCNTQENSDLPFLLDRSRSSKCTDARDRIYANLSFLLRRDEGVNIVPKYTWTLAQVYRDAAAQWINASRSLDIVRHAELKDSTDIPSWVPNWSVQRATSPLKDVLWAAGRSGAHFQFLNYGTLRATGILRGAVEMVQDINLKDFFSLAKTHSGDSTIAIYTYRIAEIRKLIPPFSENEKYLGHGSLLDAYCRVLVCGLFRDLFVPHRRDLPDFAECRDAVKLWIRSEDQDASLRVDDSSALRYLEIMKFYCKFRCIFRTSDGYLGLGPERIKAGDRIGVFLGSNYPLILRPTEKKFQVVGECYVDGLMEGEAFLGRMLADYEAVMVIHQEKGMCNLAYRNKNTRVIQNDDPRLPPPQPGTYIDDGFKRRWKNDPPWADVRLKVDALQARGLKLDQIELI